MIQQADESEGNVMEAQAEDTTEYKMSVNAYNQENRMVWEC